MPALWEPAPMPTPLPLAAVVARICAMTGHDEGAWRAAIAQDILSAGARPKAVIDARIAAGLTWKWGGKNGKPVRESTLWAWCKTLRVDPAGAAKLQKHGNAGKPGKRALTWRAFDQAMAHLPRERQEAIAQEVHALALGVYAGGAEAAFEAGHDAPGHPHNRRARGHPDPPVSAPSARSSPRPKVICAGLSGDAQGSPTKQSATFRVYRPNICRAFGATGKACASVMRSRSMCGTTTFLPAATMAPAARQ